MHWDKPFNLKIIRYASQEVGNLVDGTLQFLSDHLLDEEIEFCTEGYFHLALPLRHGQKLNPKI